jgi:tellurite resistance protein
MITNCTFSFLSDNLIPLARQAMLQRMRSRTESEVVTNDDILQGVYDKSNTVSNSHGDIPSKLRRIVHACTFSSYFSLQ